MDLKPVSIAPQGQSDVDPTPTEPMKAITENELEEYREQDRYLPIANVSRIMKRCIPTHAKISKDAKECVQECVSEFISFITSEAQERCTSEKRKTVNGEDILHAMVSLGFENYSPVVGIYLAKYRELQKSMPQTKNRNRKRPLPVDNDQTNNQEIPVETNDSDEEGSEDPGSEDEV